MLFFFNFRGVIASGGISVEDWVKILQQQEALHAAEVERWRKSIGEAAGFLKKVKEISMVYVNPSEVIFLNILRLNDFLQ